MPLDLSNFGGAARPLRASQLHVLVSCTWRGVAEMLNLERGESGPAADTGSAVHFAVAQFHRGAGEVRAAADMRGALAAFPLADLDEAERIFGRYFADPRNRNADILAIEQKIEVILPAWIEGEPPIVIHGTLDQVRRVDGVLEVWDLKTGNRDGQYMQQMHAYQIAAYSLGFPGARPGGYIRTKGYFTRGAALPSPHGVFIPACIPDPMGCLDAVRLAVSLIRSGNVTAHPGDVCGYCPMSAVEFCLPKLQEITWSR